MSFAGKSERTNSLKYLRVEVKENLKLLRFGSLTRNHVRLGRVAAGLPRHQMNVCSRRRDPRAVSAGFYIILLDLRYGLW